MIMKDLELRVLVNTTNYRVNLMNSSNNNKKIKNIFKK